MSLPAHIFMGFHQAMALELLGFHQSGNPTLINVVLALSLCALVW